MCQRRYRQTEAEWEDSIRITSRSSFTLIWGWRLTSKTNNRIYRSTNRITKMINRPPWSCSHHMRSTSPFSLKAVQSTGRDLSGLIFNTWQVNQADTYRDIIPEWWIKFNRVHTKWLTNTSIHPLQALKSPHIKMDQALKLVFPYPGKRHAGLGKSPNPTQNSYEICRNLVYIQYVFKVILQQISILIFIYFCKA